MKKVRTLGFAFENEEGEIGFRCIGVPLFDSTGRVAAAISVAGTTAQIEADSVNKLASIVKQTAMQISSHIGYDADAREMI